MLAEQTLLTAVVAAAVAVLANHSLIEGGCDASHSSFINFQTSAQIKYRDLLEYRKVYEWYHNLYFPFLIST